MRIPVLILMASVTLAHAEVHTMSLHDAVAKAFKENPDVVLARLDLVKSQAAVKVAKDPFVPKVYGGSGGAWTTGYPSNINGDPPSLFEAKTEMSIFNRQQSYGVATARENARGAEIDVSRLQDDAAYRTAALYLDVQQTAQQLDISRKQVLNLEKVEENMRARVAEGRQLAVDAKRSELNLARGRQRVEALESDLETAQRNLAVVLGFGAEDRVETTSEAAPLMDIPESEEAATEQAMGNSKEVRLLESRMQAKNLEIKGFQSARWPQVGLVAQYNLLAKYNYQDFFPGRFQRNNGQLGAFFVLPLLVGSAPKANIAQNEAELAKLHTQLDQMRNRISLDTRRSFSQLKKAETSRNVARLDLDVTREQLSILLAQYDEGRTTLADVEQVRYLENEKWIAYYDAQHMLERVKLELLHQTGMLTASLQ